MKILVITKNWIGDLLFEFPAIEALRAEWKDAEIVCLTPARCRDIAASNPAVTRALVFDERAEHRRLTARWRFAMQMRREGPWDKAFLFHRSKTRAALAFLMGARERIGYARGRRWMLTTPVEEPEKPVHHVDYFLNLVEKAGVPVRGERRYRFYPSPGDVENTRTLLREFGVSPGDYVCFHLGANWEPKRWPPSRFAEAADLIHDKWRFPVFVTGSEGDRPLAEELTAKVRRARIIPIVGRTGLGTLGALCRSSCFVVSGDSGPMHIASGSGARVAALFGPTDPNLTGPRGMGDSLVLQYIPAGYTVPWYGTIPPQGWLEHISAEELVRAVEARGWHQTGALRQG